jgi:hypothetical protein
MLLSFMVDIFSEYFKGTLEYEKNTNICISGFITYPSIQIAAIMTSIMVIRHTILLQFRLRKREFIKKWISLKKSKSRSNSVFSDRIRSQIESTQKNQHIVQLLRIFRKIFLFLMSRWFLIFTPIIWITFFQLGIFIIYSFSGWTCSYWTNTYMRYFHFFALIFSTGSIVLLFLFDLLMSCKNLVKCKCHQFWVEDDPFNARMEYGTFYLFFPLVFVWGIIPVPFFVRSILTDVLVFLAFLIGGGIALVVTIFKKIIQMINNRKL